MNITPVHLFPLLLAALAVGLMFSHVSQRRRGRNSAGDSREHFFRRGQFYRRLQTSALLAVIAGLMFVGLNVSRNDHPSVFVFLWCGVLCLTVWVLLLGLGDLWAVRTYAQSSQRRQLSKYAELERQAKNYRESKEQKDTGRGDTPAGE